MNTHSISSENERLRRAGLTAACALLASLTFGCTQTPLCPELGDCGGPIPIGTWSLDPNHVSCLEDLYQPTRDTRLFGAEIPAARVPTVEPALYDWCYLLVASRDDIQLKPPPFYTESAQIGEANVSYNADNTYTVGLTRTGTFHFDFPAACMRAFGGIDGLPADPKDPASPPVNICKQLEPRIMANGIGEGAYPNAECNPNPADPAGCLCLFDIAATSGPGGRFEVLDAHTILHYTSNNFPAKVTYCNKGTELELTGADGSYLFNQKGLRTMSLAKGNPPVDLCTNGIMDAGETGVDCGGTCATACPAPP